MKTLNIFYEEPEFDRWIKYDRYPRNFFRRVLRGKPISGGVMMVALELLKGLDKLGISYRFNDYKYIKNHPEELACIIGKPHLLTKYQWENPILFGAGIFSHPTDNVDLLKLHPNIKKLLVPGEWMRNMFEPYYHEKVQSWPVGIDTNKWFKFVKTNKKVLIYYKIRWDHERMNLELFFPIIRFLEDNNIDYDIIRYGFYKPDDLINKLKKSSCVIFLCEHETQGIAYQQILATDTPIFAWDRGGYWQDPSYYPNVKYKDVTSVPYWDKSCGTKFSNFNEFIEKWDSFNTKLKEQYFSPRDYILKNLTLEICAEKYIQIVKSLENGI